MFTDAFQRIVLRNQDVQDALDTEGKKMAAIMQAANAGCWSPDAPSQGACPVE